jgi:hypothetical protein
MSDNGDFDIAAINSAHGAADAYCRWREGEKEGQDNALSLKHN